MKDNYPKLALKPIENQNQLIELKIRNKINLLTRRCLGLRFVEQTRSSVIFWEPLRRVHPIFVFNPPPGHASSERDRSYINVIVVFFFLLHVWVRGMYKYKKKHTWKNLHLCSTRKNRVYWLLTASTVFSDKKKTPRGVLTKPTRKPVLSRPKRFH